MKKGQRSTTLIELVVYIVLISVVILALSNIDTFSRYHVINSDRGTKVQNEVSFVVDHMTKNIQRAIGSIMIMGEAPVENFGTTGSFYCFNIFVDEGFDGIIGNGRRGDEGDHWVRYRWNSANHQLWYYANWSLKPEEYEIISRRIVSFSRVIPLPGNECTTVEIRLAARWDPTQPASVDNPEVYMVANVGMPSVSTH